ncbi:unnamed protein product, partial [Urochloa humidicola]
AHLLCPSLLLAPPLPVTCSGAASVPRIAADIACHLCYQVESKESSVLLQLCVVLVGCAVPGGLLDTVARGIY